MGVKYTIDVPAFEAQSVTRVDGGTRIETTDGNAVWLDDSVLARILEEREEPPPSTVLRTAAQAEREAIRVALIHSSGKRKEAAELLQMGERTLYRKLETYGLQDYQPPRRIR
jgi:DNA-binding NtrC family response regulator